MDHDEVFEDTWMSKKDEWLEIVENDVLCTAFLHTRYSKKTAKITGFGMKNSLALPSLGWKKLKRWKMTENDGK